MVQARSAGGSPDEARRELERLLSEDQRLSEVLRTTRAQRRRLAAEIRALEAHLSFSPQVTDPEWARRAAALQGGTIADAAAMVLADRGPMRTSELLKVLQAVGKLRHSEWAYSTLAMSLRRDPRFERDQRNRGGWLLRRGSSPSI